MDYVHNFVLLDLTVYHLIVVIYSEISRHDIIR